MTDIKNEEAGEKKSLNFIEQAVEKDLKEGKMVEKCRRVSRPSPTAIFTSAMPKLFALISASQKNTAVYVTFVSTTQTLPRKMWNM